MASFRKRGRVWFYRFVDSNGVQRERKGCPDRRETEAMATMAEVEAGKIRAGLLDVKTRIYAASEGRPILEHVADWHAYLLDKGSTPKHADLSRSRVVRLISTSRAKRLSDLSPSRIQAALKAIREEGISLRSLHHY